MVFPGARRQVPAVRALKEQCTNSSIAHHVYQPQQTKHHKTTTTVHGREATDECSSHGDLLTCYLSYIFRSSEERERERERGDKGGLKEKEFQKKFH